MCVCEHRVPFFHLHSPHTIPTKPTIITAGRLDDENADNLVYLHTHNRTYDNNVK